MNPCEYHRVASNPWSIERIENWRLIQRSINEPIFVLGDQSNVLRPSPTVIIYVIKKGRNEHQSMVFVWVKSI